MNRVHLTTALLIAAAACSGGGPEADYSSEEVDDAPTANELAHTTYSGIMDEPVTLTDGWWEGEPSVDGGASRPTVGLVDHFILSGDLDEDGVDEAVTLLWENAGGSGNRLFLAAVGIRGDEINNLGTVLIGDRVQIVSGAIDTGRIDLDIVRAGPQDAACCPTQKAQVTWVLNMDGLTQVSDEPMGTLSLADLEDQEWALIELGHRQQLPEDVEINLIFKDGRVSGNSSCNSYFAGVLAPSPGELRFNGMGTTRMFCPDPAMEIERLYLKTLAGASNYRFLTGRLVLSCATDTGPSVLIFTRRS